MPVTYDRPFVTLDTALAVIKCALAEGEALGVAVSATVVDPGMNLVAFAKADGATPHSVDSSRAKANTAASTRRSTGWMGEELAMPLALATGLKLTNIAGGSPLTFDGTVGGAIGIAGGTPAQDAEIAEAAATAVDSVTPTHR